MRKIEPYKTLEGALRALDNGGRFYNLFTHAGDQVVTAAELKKVAGVVTDSQAAVQFLELASAGLGDGERRRIVEALAADARKAWARHRPTRLLPGEFAARAQPGRSYLVQGRVNRFTDATRAGMIFVPMMVGKVTTVIPVPTTERFVVYELDGPARGEECLVLVPKSTPALHGRYCFAGVAKKSEVTQAGRKVTAPRLEPSYYAELRG